MTEATTRYVLMLGGEPLATFNDKASADRAAKAVESSEDARAKNGMSDRCVVQVLALPHAPDWADKTEHGIVPFLVQLAPSAVAVLRARWPLPADVVWATDPLQALAIVQDGAPRD